MTTAKLAASAPDNSMQLPALRAAADTGRRAARTTAPSEAAATGELGVNMRISLIDAESVTPQAWRNGGGRTRELLVWPAANNWKLRISRADIETDGPFSAFAQVERWFTVVLGAGLVLSFADADSVLRVGDAPLRFDGAAAPACRLLDGPTQDLNLMLRDGVGVMRAVQADLAWDEAFLIRGLYTAVAGRWRAGQEMREVAAHSLLWSQHAGSAWTFEPDDAEAAHRAWWLGFTPKG